jgi:hypothetical protein
MDEAIQKELARTGLELRVRCQGDRGWWVGIWRLAKPWLGQREIQVDGCQYARIEDAFGLILQLLQKQPDARS